MLKRIFDIFFSFIGLVILLPFFIIIALLIVIDSPGGVFYKQARVGKNNIDFYLFKFRSMRTGADKKGLLTVGGRDSRITRMGYFIRKYKIDELPQLLNVFLGDMSLVGPRPEVRKYVDLYNEKQKKVLSVKPGITDYASIEYSNENEILGKAENPEQVYIDEIMPVKLTLNLKYIDEQGLITDLKIIFKTIGKIIK
jgi:lipopolysaccharide/colanic/teichoic acid biosynthesis glycosyltransferase